MERRRGPVVAGVEGQSEVCLERRPGVEKFYLLLYVKNGEDGCDGGRVRIDE